jgi:hypothetical protein
MNYFIGNFNCRSNLIGINTPAVANQDTGIIMQINPANLTDYLYENTLTAATINTATVQEAADRGWVIEITTGAAAGDRIRVKSAAGLILTLESNFSALPAPGDTYRLYKKTNFAIVFKPQTAQYLVGYTPNDSLDTIVEIDPVPPQAGRTDLFLASDFLVNTPIFIKIASVAWNTAFYTATTGSLILYVETSAALTVRLFDGSTLGTATYNSTGHYTIALTMPISNSLMELQVQGLGILRSATLIF